jgi:hypothetical protein
VAIRRDEVVLACHCFPPAALFLPAGSAISDRWISDRLVGPKVL